MNETFPYLWHDRIHDSHSCLTNLFLCTWYIPTGKGNGWWGCVASWVSKLCQHKHYRDRINYRREFFFMVIITHMNHNLLWKYVIKVVGKIIWALISLSVKGAHTYPNRNNSLRIPCYLYTLISSLPNRSVFKSNMMVGCLSLFRHSHKTFSSPYKYIQIYFLLALILSKQHTHKTMKSRVGINK